MDILKNKSLGSAGAANELECKQFYNSSVHCAYYSCVQLSKYVLVHKLGKSREIEENIGSFHRYYINEIKAALKNKSEHIKAVDFYKKITGLKVLREEADYEEIHASQDQSVQAISDAKFINEILINVFEL